MISIDRTVSSSGKYILVRFGLRIDTRTERTMMKMSS